MMDNRTGVSIRVFGSSYLVAVFNPDSEYQHIELKRLCQNKEELLGEGGWAYANKTLPKKIVRDPNKSKTYFAYYIDENVIGHASYMFRFRRDGAYSAWTALDDLVSVRLPAPTNVRVVRNG